MPATSITRSAVSNSLLKNASVEDSAVDDFALTPAERALFGALSMIWWRVPLSLDSAAWLMVAGVFGGFGQIAMTFSYRFAEPSLLAPFDYTSMVWAVAFGLVIFGEIPALLVLIGAAVVTAAGAFIAWREHRLGRELASRVEAI